MQLEIIRLDHIQLPIPSGQEEQARLFYGKILGLSELKKPKSLQANGGLWFQMGNIQLHLGIEDVTPSRRRHPAFEVLHLSDIQHYFEKQGLELRLDPPIPGWNRFSFFDPFGNRIEFLERNTLIEEQI